MAVVTPVVLSGGSGTRLWPASRTASPKQLHRLVGEHTLLQGTMLRVGQGADAPFGPAVVICNRAYAEQTRQQLEAIQPPPLLILEPFGRNTAACAAVAAAWKMQQGDPEGLVLLAASDHHMADPAPFRAAVASAVEAALDGWIVTFGIKPTAPETGFGYVRRGAPLGPVFESAGFVEKPNLETARSYLVAGDYFWNASYFLFRADRMWSDMQRLQPAIAEAAMAALARGERRDGMIFLDPEAFNACPSDSIDFAIMEKADKIALAPVDAPWSDLGSWAAIWEAQAKDAAGNAVSGAAQLLDSRGCLVSTDGPLVAVIDGLDLVVVVKDGAVLVAPRDSAQKVKTVVEALRAAGREDLL